MTESAMLSPVAFERFVMDRVVACGRLAQIACGDIDKAEDLPRRAAAVSLADRVLKTFERLVTCLQKLRESNRWIADALGQRSVEALGAEQEPTAALDELSAAPEAPRNRAERRRAERLKRKLESQAARTARA